MRGYPLPYWTWIFQTYKINKCLGNKYVYRSSKYQNYYSNITRFTWNCNWICRWSQIFSLVCYVLGDNECTSAYFPNLNLSTTEHNSERIKETFLSHQQTILFSCQQSRLLFLGCGGTSIVYFFHFVFVDGIKSSVHTGHAPG